MKREKDLKRYGKVFSQLLSNYLKEKFSISIDIYPTETDGAILKFNINDTDKKVRLHKPAKSVGVALGEIEQNFIEVVDFSKVKFEGTNLFMDDNWVVLIKGENDQQSWSNKAAGEDVKRIVESSLGSSNA
ncbi:hypothetical protein [Microbulbifer sp. DLAB2-AA]|uniref:hypothetical protein n=1 Tax=Microbulbifer sp. DLAB2-AA TaxID=3243394 RepID=UPI004039E39D